MNITGVRTGEPMGSFFRLYCSEGKIWVCSLLLDHTYLLSRNPPPLFFFLPLHEVEIWPPRHILVFLPSLGGADLQSHTSFCHGYKYYCLGKGGKRNCGCEESSRQLDAAFEACPLSESNQPLSPRAAEWTHWCKTTLYAERHGLAQLTRGHSDSLLRPSPKWDFHT